VSGPAPTGSALVAEARAGVRGVLLMLAFRDGWRACFTPTQTGALRSFIGVLLAFPAFWFMVSSANFFMAENPGPDGPSAMIGAGERLLIWARLWLLFPIVAWGVCALMGLRERFFAWLAVHNWTVFVLVHLQALFWALYMAGLADPGSLGLVLTVYQVARLFVHWRVAHGALGLSPGLSAAVAGVPILADLIVATTLV
jgi:hypothetical protein